MSRSLVGTNKDKNNKELSKLSQLPANQSPVKANYPSLREVNVPAKLDDTKSIITAYKDLNQPARDFALNQKKHLIIAFLVFFALGLGIMMGQKKNRAVATVEMSKLIPENAVPTTNEHYLYEKNCYKGPNGEDICITRSSRKNN